MPRMLRCGKIKPTRGSKVLKLAIPLPGSDGPKSFTHLTRYLSTLDVVPIVKGMKFRREDVYICNIVKCRPPDNRTPSGEEAQACLGYLRRQIELIQPAVIVTLGATPLMAAASTLQTEAVKALLSRGADITKKSKFGATARDLAKKRNVTKASRELEIYLAQELNKAGVSTPIPPPFNPDMAG